MDSDTLLKIGATRWELESPYRLVDGLSDYCRGVERIFDLRRGSVFAYESTNTEGTPTGALVIGMWMDEPLPACTIGSHFVVLQNGRMGEPLHGLKSFEELRLQRCTQHTIPEEMRERAHEATVGAFKQVQEKRQKRRDFGTWLAKKHPGSRVADRMKRGI